MKTKTLILTITFLSLITAASSQLEFRTENPIESYSNLDMRENTIENLTMTPTPSGDEAVTERYLSQKYLRNSNGVLRGPLDANDRNITEVGKLQMTGKINMTRNEIQSLLNIKSVSNNDLRIGAGAGGSDRVRIRDNANGEDIAEFEEGTQNVYIPKGKLNVNQPQSTKGVLNVGGNFTVGNDKFNIGAKNKKDSIVIGEPDQLSLEYDEDKNKFLIKDIDDNQVLIKFEANGNSNVRIPNGNLDVSENNITNIDTLKFEEGTKINGDIEINGTINTTGDLDLQNNNLLDANTVQANNLEDPNDQKLDLQDNINMNDNSILMGDGNSQEVDFNGVDAYYNEYDNKGLAIDARDNSNNARISLLTDTGVRPYIEGINSGFDLNGMVRIQNGNTEINNGNLILANNKDIQLKDTGGTPQEVLNVDSGDNLNLKGTSGARLRIMSGGRAYYEGDSTGKIIELQDSNGNVLIPNGNLKVTNQRIDAGSLRIGSESAASFEKPILTYPGPQNGWAKMDLHADGGNRKPMLRMYPVGSQTNSVLKMWSESDISTNPEVEIQANGRTKLGGGNVRITNGNLELTASNSVTWQNANYELKQINNGGMRLESGADIQLYDADGSQKGLVMKDSAGIRIPNGNLDMATNQISNLADPSSSQDAATKSYVDSTESDNQDLSSTSDVTGTNDRIEITGGSNTVIDDDFAADDQNLGYSNDNSPTGSYTTHTITVDDGSNTGIRDYYDPDTDNQDLSTIADVSGTDDRIEIAGGSNTVIDDDFAADDQNLGTSGNQITLDNGGSITAPYANNADQLDGNQLSSVRSHSGDSITDNTIDNSEVQNSDRFSFQNFNERYSWDISSGSGTNTFKIGEIRDRNFGAKVSITRAVDQGNNQVSHQDVYISKRGSTANAIGVLRGTRGQDVELILTETSNDANNDGYNDAYLYIRCADYCQTDVEMKKSTGGFTREKTSGASIAGTVKYDASDISLRQASSGNLDLNSNKITNLADPGNAQDAATKSYVDSSDNTGTDDQNLGYSNDNAPTGSYATHTVTINGGSNTGIRDYYDSNTDSQSLSATADVSGTNDRIEIAGGSNTVIDDDFAADNQNLGTSGNQITLDNGGSVTAPYAQNSGTAYSLNQLSNGGGIRTGVTSGGRIWIAPYDGSGSENYNREITYDPSNGEWNLEGAPQAGGQRIATRNWANNNDDFAADDQNLGYSNDNAPTGSYATHTLTIDSGTDAGIRDYYDSNTDSQDLSTTADVSGTNDRIEIAGGSNTVIDDDYAADDQDLSTNADVSGTNDRIEIAGGSNTVIDDDYAADDQNLGQVLNQGNTVNQNIDMNGNNLNNYFEGTCGQYQAVKNINANGSIVCGQAGGGLPVVLDIDNTANQNINMNGNNLNNAQNITASGTIEANGKMVVPVGADAGL